ncbi:ArsR/SmtB family transcription factor [Microbacterium soli]|uniref:SRPBCC domain-containing protein n=1 Tax=Microbacterium soli TaxID=446075 RepID=A0ABP7N0A9_9MICO
MPAPDAERTLRALVEPHRRALLDALRAEDGRSVGELESAVPELGRHAVLKHLRILEDAGLVSTRKVGRRRLVHLDPTPLVDLARRWLDDYSAFAGLALTRLRDHLESGRRIEGVRMSETKTLVATIVIEATPERVWSALTDPEQSRRWFFGGLVRSDWGVGDAIQWRSADGAVLIAGEITAIERGALLAHTFRALWSKETAADPASHYEWRLEALGEAMTRVTVTHTGVTAGSATHLQADGGTSLVISALKTFIETGRTMPGMG